MACFVFFGAYPPILVDSHAKHPTQRSDSNVTFLCNDSPNNYTVSYMGFDYFLCNASVSIIDSNGKQLFNTAIIENEGSLATKRVYNTLFKGSTDLKWSFWEETYPLNGDPQKRGDSPIINEKGPLEQLITGNDTYEYLVYELNTPLPPSFTSSKKHKKQRTIYHPNGAWTSSQLNWKGRLANAYIVFINGQFRGYAQNFDHKAGNLNYSLTLYEMGDGEYNLSIVSSSWGIDNRMTPEDGDKGQEMKGIIDEIYFSDYISGDVLLDLSKAKWSHWLGTTGEVLEVCWFLAVLLVFLRART